LQVLTEPGRDFFEQVGGGMTRGQAESLAYTRRETADDLSYGEVIFAPFVQDMDDVLREIRERLLCYLLCHDEHPGVHYMSCETSFCCCEHCAIIRSAERNVNSQPPLYSLSIHYPSES